jgi:hypothetical protein
MVKDNAVMSIQRAWKKYREHLIRLEKEQESYDRYYNDENNHRSYTRICCNCGDEYDPKDTCYSGYCGKRCMKNDYN